MNEIERLTDPELLREIELCESDKSDCTELARDYKYLSTRADYTDEEKAEFLEKSKKQELLAYDAGTRLVELNAERIRRKLL